MWSDRLIHTSASLGEQGSSFHGSLVIAATCIPMNVVDKSGTYKSDARSPMVLGQCAEDHFGEWYFIAVYWPKNASTLGHFSTDKPRRISNIMLTLNLTKCVHRKDQAVNRTVANCHWRIKPPRDCSRLNVPVLTNRAAGNLPTTRIRRDIIQKKDDSISKSMAICRLQRLGTVCDLSRVASQNQGCCRLMLSSGQLFLEPNVSYAALLFIGLTGHYSVFLFLLIDLSPP